MKPLRDFMRRLMGGGPGYTEDRLRGLWSDGGFEIVELRQMDEHPAGGAVFGKDFLWVMLARKNETPLLAVDSIPCHRQNTFSATPRPIRRPSFSRSHTPGRLC